MTSEAHDSQAPDLEAAAFGAVTVEEFCQKLAEAFDLPHAPEPGQTFDELGFDSMHLLELWYAFEDLCDEPVSPEAVAALDTIAELHQLWRQLAQRAS